MKPTKTGWLLSAAICCWLGTGTVLAFSPMLFSAAQRWAATCVLAEAQISPDKQISLHVVRTLFGRIDANPVIITHPESLSGSKVRSGHLYLVLLAPDGQPIRTDVGGTNGPGYFCGVINALEVVGGVVVDAKLYDVQHGSGPKPVSMDDIESQLRQAHKGDDGV